MPFIVPAMGSHGGATPEGQLQVLADLGLTEASMGCAFKATMDTVVLGQTAKGLPAQIDRHAAEAELADLAFRHPIGGDAAVLQPLDDAEQVRTRGDAG